MTGAIPGVEVMRFALLFWAWVSFAFGLVSYAHAGSVTIQPERPSPADSIVVTSSEICGGATKTFESIANGNVINILEHRSDSFVAGTCTATYTLGKLGIGVYQIQWIITFADLPGGQPLLAGTATIAVQPSPQPVPTLSPAVGAAMGVILLIFGIGRIRRNLRTAPVETVVH